ncbi:DEDD exonuclease domain-containing protein [Williamsia sp. CHRR-6]|uniref:DEDD exonuclease domain-containing protein n=1 Tax=Williamsia sp. CHRR-6 TaxID=2835871 RepID=UPI001BDAC820|nr:DEDD exonuclease domain-containing protein [Williamsia sp. CHRR-6]
MSTGSQVLRGQSTTATQLSFDSVVDSGFDALLSEVTFVVVDLETTGGSPRTDRITEIGAVKVRGGEVLGELATLIDPGCPIPPHIVSLTGITEAMVYRAPRIDEVLPAFLEFARGCVLVAHNARFDTGFLRAAAAESGHAWTLRQVLCTVTLARRVLPRDELPTVKLSALARHFSVPTTPTHRALDDARATVEVMHALFERVGNIGVQTYRELLDYLPNLTRAQRAKRDLTDGLPARPGVYLFRGPTDEVLYVGTATDLRRRTRQYFSGSETRSRMREMISLATRVDHVECAHRLEAGVRELRLLAAHAPAFNRRSTAPHRAWWVSLTDEAFPRLSITRRPTETAVGPIRSRADASAVAGIITAATRLRSCTHRIGVAGLHTCSVDDGRRPVGGCHAAAAAPLGPTEYGDRVTAAAAVMAGHDDAPLIATLQRLHRLSESEMFESAARLRDRIDITFAALGRCQLLAGLCAIAELVAAGPDGTGGWELIVVRHGQLAAAGTARRGVPPIPVAAALAASAQTITPEAGPLRGAPAEEAWLIYRWLTSGDTRIVCSTSGFTSPVGSAARWSTWRATAAAARSRYRELFALAS